MRLLADDVWVFDGEAVPFLGLPFTTRMTVIRLSGGELWVHSPIRLTASLQSLIDELGCVKYLIAPNHLHHLFLNDWLEAYPDALSFGTDEVIRKRSDLGFTASLNQQQHWPWQEEIEQVLFTGSPLMEECVFYHTDSGVLVVTDLVENFSGDDFNRWQRLLAKGAGILAPHGKMPIDWRLSFTFGKSEARQHINAIIAWQPQKIVMAHGVIIEENAVGFLERSFRWLI